MQYQLVWKACGMFMTATFNEDNVIPAMEVRGFELTGVNNNPRQREELQGQPKFKGLVGPCYGGPGIIRYECTETYAFLSQDA